jgi:hypothetical protein
MIGLKYPKIETLYNRDDKFKVIPVDLRCPEFSLVNQWILTEKIDGTNVRVALHSDGSIEIGGRTDRADMPVRLITYLRGLFTVERMAGAFVPTDGVYPEVILFGEGYGAGIQNGGKYNPDPRFRVFDCVVAGEVAGGWWWMQYDQLCDIAGRLDIPMAPKIGMTGTLPKTKDDLEFILSYSHVARDENNQVIQPEGIVARPPFLLFDRRGDRIMWKLKYRDF